MIGDATSPAQTRIPRELLLDALHVRDQQLAGEQPETAIAELDVRIDAFCDHQPTFEPNRKLVAHLTGERDSLLTFLTRPGVAATNHRAERAIRPMVCTRKQWGGNKTRQGADTTTVGSILQTAAQQDVDPIDVIAHIRRTGRPPPQLELTGPPSP